MGKMDFCPFKNVKVYSPSSIFLENLIEDSDWLCCSPMPPRECPTLGSIPTLDLRQRVL